MDRLIRRATRIWNFLTSLRGYKPPLIGLAISVALTYPIGWLGLPKWIAAPVLLTYLLDMLIGACCGYGPGVLTISLTLLGAPFLFEPKHSLRNVNWGGFALLMLVSLLISSLSSRRRRAEENLEQEAQRGERETEKAAGQLAEQESANRAKTVFLSTISHEIRTPMNAILGYAQLMMRDPDLSETSKANVKIIIRSGEHLLGLINEVLDMSKIEAGRMELIVATFSLDKMLEDLETMFRLKAKAKAIDFEMSIEGVREPYAVGDEGKLRQALINLLGNAIKFTERGYVRVHVNLEERGSDLWFSARFEDTGPGIGEDEQARLFEPFSQTRSGSLNAESTGLGLSISRKFARLMGGDITLTSRKGQGSVFVFEAPLQRGQSEAVLKNARDAAIRRVTGISGVGERPRILIVDDQPENRDWLRRLLAATGFPVEEAENGEIALRRCAEFRPHLVLMDMHMPVMDGLEATRRIKTSSESAETRIVILTASAMVTDREKVQQCGADGFLAKPAREDELFRKIGVLLNISYEYEEEAASQDGAQTSQDLTALSAHLSRELPADLIDKLRDATRRGNKGQLDRLIVQVRSCEKNEFASALQQLADRYDYEALTQFLGDASR